MLTDEAAKDRQGNDFVAWQMPLFGVAVVRGVDERLDI